MSQENSRARPVLAAVSRRQVKKGGTWRVPAPIRPIGAIEYAFIVAFTASAVIGNERTRGPTALKRALPIAITVTAGSPLPMMLTSISGIWLIPIGA